MTWKGRRLQLGTAELEVLDPCPRCVMVTRAVGDDLPADWAVLRHIVRDLGQDLGVYATVGAGGTIRPGDPVELD